MVARRWSISALAVELSADRRTIAAALADVPPAGKSRGSPTYRMADAVAALYGTVDPSRAGAAPRRQRLDLTAESARLKKAQADKTELEVDVLRGTLIPAETVLLIWANFVTAARAKFISLPSTAAPRVIGLESVREVETELRELVHAGLSELKEYDGGEYGNGASVGGTIESGPIDRPAAVPDGFPVGGRKSNPKPGGRKRTGPVAD